MSDVLKVTKAKTFSLADASPVLLLTRTPLNVTDGSASSVTCSKGNNRLKDGILLLKKDTRVCDMQSVTHHSIKISFVAHASFSH
jgi:hypothetical protein